MDENVPTPADGSSPPRVPIDPQELATWIRQATPARVFVGRAGSSYRTQTQLELRSDHAAAVDAVRSELDLVRDLGAEFVSRWQIQEVQTQAHDKNEYLLRPDLGRRFDAAAATLLGQFAARGADIQVAIGDGLSAAAVKTQVPLLLPLLASECVQRGLRFGVPFFVRHCRVGILNEIGELLDPVVVILLIGERPGLATAASLSAYLAYRPREGHTDAQRNLISNIHARGSAPASAAVRIMRLADQLINKQTSGVMIKELHQDLDREAIAHDPG